MKPEEIQVGRTYLGKSGDPRTVYKLIGHIVAFKKLAGGAKHYGRLPINGFAKWAQSVVPVSEPTDASKEDEHER